MADDAMLLAATPPAPFTVMHAVVLGVVQGVTEFLPVSSTAHLKLVPWIMNWEDPGLTFDVALHAGTLVAVLGFFFTTWLRILRAAMGAAIDIHTGQAISGPEVVTQRRLLWYLVLATIPAGVAGLLFERHIETNWRNPLIIAASLIGVGIVMGIADRRRSGGKEFNQVTLADSSVIGLSQALAVIPGVSRSAITITSGLFRGMTREASARFSFLLATPIIAGAALKKWHDVHKAGGLPPGMKLPFEAGVAASALVGLLSIWLLIRFLRARSLQVFVYYRIVLGIIVIALYFSGIRAL